MSEIERGELGFKIHSRIIEREETRRRLLAENAVDLCHMYEQKLYKDYFGDEAAPWAAYLGEVNIFYSRNQIDSYIKVYRKFSRELEIPPEVWVEVPISRLVDILPIVTKEDVEEWLVKGKMLLTKDWSIVVRQAKGLLSEEDHEDHDNNVYKICKVCGKKELVHEHE